MKLKLTEEELNEVVKEIAERIKDMAYMNLENRVRDVVGKILGVDVDEDDKLTFEWKVTMVVGDILQIVGRKRRMEAKEL